MSENLKWNTVQWNLIYKNREKSNVTSILYKIIILWLKRNTQLMLQYLNQLIVSDMLSIWCLIKLDHFQNKDGLLYVEVKFDTTSNKGNPVIHGEDEKTDYATVDFPLPTTPHEVTGDDKI